MEYSSSKLESWIHHSVKKTLYVHNGSQSMAREQINKYHVVCLQKTLNYAYKRSDFYRKHFDDAGFRPEQFKSLADLAKIPFTEQEFLHNQPYKLLCISAGDVERVVTFTTSGTTGPQKKVFFSSDDLNNIVKFMGIGLSHVINGGEAIVILLPDTGPNGEARLLAKGASTIGAVPFIAGTAMDIWEQLELIQRVKPKVVFGSISRMYRVTQDGNPHYDLSGFGVRVIYVTSDFVSEALRRNMEKAWHAEVYVHYGMTEMGLGVAIECQSHDGYHFNEKDLMIEVIDPHSQEPVGFGQEGELVFTTLARHAMPLIRYRTHDLSRVTHNECLCGASTLLKIGKVCKRLMPVVALSQGVSIYPSMFDEVVYHVPEVVDYRITVNRNGKLEVLDLEVEVTKERGNLPAEIAEKMASVAPVQDLLGRQMLRLGEIVLLPPGGLKRTGRAKKVIRDKRFAESDLGNAKE